MWLVRLLLNNFRRISPCTFSHNMRLTSTIRVITFFCFSCCVLNPIVAASDSTKTQQENDQKYFVINNITISGNKKTKKRILLRELPFKVGDTIQQNKLDATLLRAKNNLMNIALFIFVEVDTIPFYSNTINIHINVKERWYIFPVPLFEIYERNFNTWLDNPNLQRASYGFYLIHENFRGAKENLSLKVRLGYAEQYSLNYKIPYIDKNQKSGLGFGFSYNRNHEIIYKTINNKLLFYKNPNAKVRDEWLGKINYTHRSGLYNTQSAELRYLKSSVSDTLLVLTKDYFGSNEKLFQLFIASYSFRRDIRDYRPYPLKGYFFSFDFVKQGLGLLANEGTDQFYLVASYRKYWKLYNRFYFGAAVKGKMSAYNKQPYYVQRALGYGDYVRGYELYVIDGQNYGLLQTNFRYQIVKPKVMHLSFIPTDKFNTIPYSFYFSLFADGAYVRDNYYYKNNPLTNDWLGGIGAGLDFVTYYDTVIRFEYAYNRMREGAFYIHLSAPF